MAFISMNFLLLLLGCTLVWSLPVEETADQTGSDAPSAAADTVPAAAAAAAADSSELDPDTRTLGLKLKLFRRPVKKPSAVVVTNPVYTPATVVSQGAITNGEKPVVIPISGSGVQSQILGSSGGTVGGLIPNKINTALQIGSAVATAPIRLVLLKGTLAANALGNLFNIGSDNRPILVQNNGRPTVVSSANILSSSPTVVPVGLNSGSLFGRPVLGGVPNSVNLLPSSSGSVILSGSALGNRPGLSLLDIASLKPALAASLLGLPLRQRPVVQFIPYHPDDHHQNYYHDYNHYDHRPYKPIHPHSLFQSADQSMVDSAQQADSSSILEEAVQADAVHVDNETEKA